MSFFCWLTRRRLGAYQDGELPPSARTKTEGHLVRCGTCAAELAGLARLRAALTQAVPEPAEAVWQTFWPQVRGRLAALPEPETRWQRAWGRVTTHRRLAFGSALAATALGVLAILAPWQQVAERLRPTREEAPRVVASGPARPAQPQQVVVHSVETADPQSSVMVFTSPESDFTVVWVFGLQPTDI